MALARTFVLNDLHVDAGSRRRGVGAALPRAAVAHGHAVGAVRPSLSTEHADLTTQAVYDREGWQRDTRVLVFHRPLPLPVDDPTAAAPPSSLPPGRLPGSR